ncbi:MAG: MaoC family dehydratase N-terminal domain-containing protein [Novosphingobium sp.]|jgi:acyl dehydratase|nr:MaoC family dehydratase N-terminal domain-containing protein [Novosphingobium sp.]
MIDDKYPSLLWENVVEGQDLPGFDYELSMLRLIAFVRATGLYDYVHHDPDYSRAVGIRDAFAATPHIGGLFCRAVTDWTGPLGLIRRIEFRMTGQCLRNDNLRVSGKVAGKQHGADGSALVDVELNIATGTAPSVATARVTVALPAANSHMPPVSRDRDPDDVIVSNGDMPDFAREYLGQVREGNREPRDPLLASDIHMWCEALEDWNPLYWDKGFATASPVGGLVSPPIGLFYGAGSAINVGLGHRKPGALVPEPIVQGLHGMELMSALRQELVRGGVPFPPPDCPETVVTNAIYNFYRPLRVGDTLRSEQRLATCSQLRKTRLGEGYFTSGENLLFNQHDELVRTTMLNLFCYRV